MPQAGHQVFISYATPDRDAADRVLRALESAGLSCWIATRDIEAGTIFPATIVEALNAARAMVLILTDHAVASPHVLSEVGYAFNARKRIVPFRLSHVTLPDEMAYYLSLTQWLDAPDGCTDQNLARLTEATRDCVAGKTPAPGAPERRRRTRSIALLVAGLLAVGGGAVYWGWPRPGAQSAGDSSDPSGSGRRAAAERKTWLNPEDGQTYVWIPPGTFTMGCSPGDDRCRDDERPAHQVRIEKGFWLGQKEVTVRAYRRVAAARGMKAPSGDDDLPVTGVTWADAKKFCAAVGGRLPTEAEWEFAARGGTSQPYYGTPASIAWYGEEARSLPHPVGTKSPNAFGLYDTLGNVGEWVLDRYYNRLDPAAPPTGTDVEQPLAANATAVARGGFWGGDVTSIRASHRAPMEPDTADPTIGFRCASDHSP
jgi:formylglycine-generating enzyme required for sulfatase activity